MKHTFKKFGLLILVVTVIFFLLLAIILNSQKSFQENKSESSVDPFLAYNFEKVESTETVEYFLEAKEGKFGFDKNFKTKLWMYNKKIAPVLKVKKGQKIKINLKNSLKEETTIHWHGIRLPNNMDGVPALTQDPVKSGDNFMYEFIPRDAGTFWFHPHVNGSEQQGRGLYGILIVEDEEKIPYSQDIVWALDDWRLDIKKEIQSSFGNMHDSMMSGRWGNIITINGKVLPTLNFNPGERIRLRIINTSNARIYDLDFGEIKANVIAVDGMYVKKTFNYDGFYLAPGNRIDLDIRIPTNFYNKTILVKDKISNGIEIAKINISKSEDRNKYNFDFPENKNIPDYGEFLKKEVDVIYDLDLSGMMMNGNWTINNKIFGKDTPEIYEKNKFYKIRFNNLSSIAHPMHIHGQFFKVISRDGDNNGENFFRDTVLILPNEKVDVVMFASDVGKWLNHCHILEHADSGMTTSIIVK